MIVQSRSSVLIRRFVLLVAVSGHASAAVIPDHEEIMGPFEDGPDVTRLCLECHEDAARDFMRTSHWTWATVQTLPGRGPVAHGKKTALNNFCIAITSNWPACTGCHAGYGWKDANFDFSDPTRIDCLVCHDTTGEYVKTKGGAGHERPGLDLETIARNVGPPGRGNCGACHFFGGGGLAVKHGDLSTALLASGRDFDVHMSIDGENLRCQDCHETDRHRLVGNTMMASPAGENHAACTGCHETLVHAAPVLDRHVRSVACQTCHIPTFAKAIPTKVSWDWSTAGQDRTVGTDGYGMPTYSRMKGSFTWGMHIVPTYAWYNGRAGAYLVGDRIDPAAVTRLNWPLGDRNDPDARIYPFKVHRGQQIYDAGFDYLIVPHLYGEGGFWESWDWQRAARDGMAAVGLPYSGRYGFAPTVMYWRINHMVVPKSQALKCGDCHAREGGRLDWAALGYAGDPMHVPGQARYPMDQ